MPAHKLELNRNTKAVRVARWFCCAVGTLLLGVGVASWNAASHIPVGWFFALLSGIVGIMFVLVGLFRPPKAVVGVLSHYIENLE